MLTQIVEAKIRGPRRLISITGSMHSRRKRRSVTVIYVEQRNREPRGVSQGDEILQALSVRFRILESRCYRSLLWRGFSQDAREVFRHSLISRSGIIFPIPQRLEWSCRTLYCT